MRKAIAIDFDGCLCTDGYPAIGKPNQAVIDRAKREQEDGAGLILWTCQEGQLLQEAVNACREWGLTFDSINESLPDWIEAFGTHPRKVGASEYWDDRAVQMPAIPPPNDPLTLDELLKMDGELVWVIPFEKSFKDEYALVNVANEWICTFTTKYWMLKGCGKRFLAYRRKPEEVQE